MKRARVVAVLLLLACHREKPAPDAELQATLQVMRGAIKSFHRDNGRYPHSLEELVPKYLRRIPVDPVTGSTETWRLTTEEIVPQNADFTTAAQKTQTYVLDVHSGAGAPYSNW